MEVIEILQPLLIDQWSLLRDTLKRDWPTYAYYYYFINNSIDWKRKDPQLRLQFFCPDGDVNSGTFVGISTQTEHVVYIFTFEESRDLLRRILTESKVINWNESIVFAGVHPHYDDLLKDTIEEKGEEKNITLAYKSVRYYYFKSKDECAQLEVPIPKKCELRNLNETHIPLIHSLWPHRSETEPEKTTKILRTLVNFNGGMGLFLKKDNYLVSWILRNDWGGLGMLQTLEEHKRKGYGKIVTQAMVKKLAVECDCDSFAFVFDENFVSQKFFESVGFQRLKGATWYFMKANKNVQ